jgi:hypothetical protein
MLSGVYPSVDDHLARDVFAAVGVDRADGVEAITRGLRSWLPAGSTAKWLAVDAGRVPPGADPSEALEARLDGSLESWSCWVFCTSVGALLANAGHDVQIVVEHHRTASVVDFHSVLLVDGALLDPYLGPSAPVPAGHDVTRGDAWAAWIPADLPGGRWDHLGLRGGGGIFRYRLLGDRLERPDVAAFCEISTTHSGVGRRRNAHWVVGERLWFVREGDDGGAELRVAEGSSPFEQRRRVVARGPYEELRAHIDHPEDAA